MDNTVNDFLRAREHYQTCNQCYCSMSRAQFHIKQIDNQQAVAQEFTAPQTAAPLGLSGSGTPIPASVEPTEVPSCACTICTEVRMARESQQLNASVYSWSNQVLSNLLGGSRQLAEDKPPVVEPEGDCLRV